MSYTNAITKEVIPLNQISGGFTVPYHKQGIVTASGLMRKNQHTIATLSLSQLWATLPLGIKELLYDSNELVNYDDIMSFYKNHQTHHALSSQTYAPENSILLANYYEHHTNTDDPQNLMIVTNLIYNVIFLTFANLTHDENNNQVSFTTAIDHFYNRGKIHGEGQEAKVKGVLKLIDTALGTTLESNDDILQSKKTEESKQGSLNELVFQNDFPRLLDMYRLVGKTQKELLTARTKEEESTTIDYQDDNDSKSESKGERTITINMPTLSLASSMLTTADLTTPTAVEPKPTASTVQFTKKITQGNVGTNHWTGEWYGSTLLLATDLTKQQSQKSSLTMKVITHATSTVLIFIFLLFYIKKSRQLLIMHELKQQKRGNRKKNKENWKVCFTS